MTCVLVEKFTKFVLLITTNYKHHQRCHILLFTMSPIWYLDFEGYHFDNTFFVKEIAILNSDTLECFNYFVQNPRKIPHLPNTAATNYQYKKHNLRWTFGDYHFWEAIGDIMSKIKNDAVFAKGPEKVKFLQTWLPQIEDMTWINTPFKNLYNCITDVCDVKHGLTCARRKVNELRYIDCMYKNL